MVDGDERVLVATIDGLLDLVLRDEARWRSRFESGGIVTDEGHLVFGREKRVEVAGQLLPLAPPRQKW